MAKTIAEAKRQGKSTYTGKDGKQKAAVTREELSAWEKKTGKKGLGAFLNARNAKGKAPDKKSTAVPSGSLSAKQRGETPPRKSTAVPSGKLSAKQRGETPPRKSTAVPSGKLSDKLRGKKPTSRAKLEKVKVTAKKKNK